MYGRFLDMSLIVALMHASYMMHVLKTDDFKLHVCVCVCVCVCVFVCVCGGEPNVT